MKAYVASDLKEMNRRTVFSFIATAGETSKAEISRKTGISSPTVIKIVNHFIKKGLVLEQESTEGQTVESYVESGQRPMGRRPCVLAFNRNAACSLGVEFEGNYLKIGLVNLAYEMVAFEKIHVEEGFEQIFSRRLPGIIKSMTRRSAPKTSFILGLGIGIPSVIDPLTKVIEATPLIGLESRFDARRLLTKLEHELSMPVFIENDVKAAAMGEYWSRGTGIPDMAYVSLGTGFAAGIIMNGVLRKGPRNIAGEIGYLVSRGSISNSLDRPGPLEQEVNISHIERSLGLSWEAVVRDESKRGPVADLIAESVSVAIANVCISLDIDCVVLGGLLSEYLGAAFVSRVDERVRNLSITDVHVSASSHCQPGIAGAAHIVMTATLDSLLA